MADRIIIMNGGKIDQADDPRTCYLKPGTALVAGLLGAGNDLQKTQIVETEKDSCRVRIGGETVEGMYFPGEDYSGTGSSPRNAQVRFRPEDGHWLGGRAQGNCFQARSVLSTFEGGCYRVKMQTEDGQEFCILHQEPIPEEENGYVQVGKEQLYVYESPVH